MKVWGVTDIGLVRKENQDAFLLREQTASGHTVCVVCDGMGGSAGGRMASKIATETFMDEMERVLSPGMEPEQLKAVSSYAVALANDAIQAAAEEVEEYRNMGTTLVCAVSYDGGVVISNVGDSRAYHITENGITRITRDHSLVEELVRMGQITREQARTHPRRNIITRALGTERSVEGDLFIHKVVPGELLLLCSDGLTNELSDSELWEYTVTGGAETACKRLIDGALVRGAHDNVTAALMELQSDTER